MSYHYGGPRIPGSYYYGGISGVSAFYSISGGYLKRRPSKPYKEDTFEKILRAPFRKPQKAVPAFSPESFVPFAKMGMAKAFSKALLSETASSILVLPKSSPAPYYDDEGIPDEVIILALM